MEQDPFFEQRLRDWRGIPELSMVIVRSPEAKSRVERLSRIRQSFDFPRGLPPLVNRPRERPSRGFDRPVPHLLPTYLWRPAASELLHLSDLLTLWSQYGYQPVDIDEAADFEATYRHLRRTDRTLMLLGPFAIAGTYGPDDARQRRTIPIRTEDGMRTELRFEAPEDDHLFDGDLSFLLTPVVYGADEVRLPPHLLDDPFFTAPRP